MRLGETCVVAATFQEARHFTASTAQRYRDLVERTGFVCALGEALPAEPLPGVRGAALPADDPVRGEWDVVVLGPHFARGAAGPRPRRRRPRRWTACFEYALTYDRDAVIRAAAALIWRVAPRRSPTRRRARGPSAPRRSGPGARRRCRDHPGGQRRRCCAARSPPRPTGSPSSTCGAPTSR